MLFGKVIGSLWATKRVPGLEQDKLMLVQVLKAGNDAGGQPVAEGSVLVAVDTIDAGPGDLVTVSLGSGGRNVLNPCDNRHILVDAAISRIVDGQERI